MREEKFPKYFEIAALKVIFNKLKNDKKERLIK